MLRLILALIVFTPLYFTTLGADLKYPVSLIPDELKKDVNVVVREDQMVFTIKARNNASLRVHFVATILNEKGKNRAELTLGYSKLRRLVDLNAVVYDAVGRQVKKLKNNDIIDHAAYDGFSLFSDYRIKSIDLTQSSYPYTVEFEYEIEYKYLYSIDGSAIASRTSSTQHASYQLIYPKNLTPRYKLINIEATPKQEMLSNGLESLTWVFENVLPYQTEPHGPLAEDLVPRIIAAPTLFEYEGYQGTMSSWKEFGNWNAQLNKNRDILPEKTKSKVKELTNGLTTTEQKTKALYDYLQSKTRYVSIQLGIGGLQPFPASVVDETGYGDCKALSNYMVAMLKEAGIKAYYTTIQAGDNESEVISDFPSHQANHVIVAVPNNKDTIWLECTSQTKPFGFMGTFTGDRLALMITEDGGKLVRTPVYTADQNRQTRTAEVFVELTGDAKAKVKTTYSGLQYDNDNLDHYVNATYEDQKKWIRENTDIPGFDVSTFSMVNKKYVIPSAVVNLDVVLKRYASVSGKRLFLTPNLMNRSTYVPKKIETRKSKVITRFAFTDIDTVNFNIPEALYPEFIPEPMKINSRFGEYESSFKLEQGKLIYIRKIKRIKGEFSPETYNELIDFYKNVNKADNIKIVFLNKT